MKLYCYLKKALCMKFVLPMMLLIVICTTIRVKGQSLNRLEVEELVVKRADGKGYIVIGFSESMNPQIRIIDADSVARIVMTTVGNEASIRIANRSSELVCQLSVNDTITEVVASDTRRDKGASGRLSTVRRDNGVRSTLALSSDSSRYMYESFVSGEVYQEKVYFNETSNSSDRPIAYRYYSPWSQDLSLGYRSKLVNGGREQGTVFLSAGMGFGELEIADYLGVPRIGLRTSPLGHRFFIRDSSGYQKVSLALEDDQDARLTMFASSYFIDLYASMYGGGLHVSSEDVDRLSLVSGPKDTRLALTGSGRSTRVSLKSSEDESSLAMFSPHVLNTVQMSATDSSANIGLYDASGSLRASIGSTHFANKQGGMTTSPLSSFNLFDAAGVKLFSAP